MFQIIGSIKEVKVIAAQKSIRELKRLEETYGPARWRKLKGTALVRIEGEVVKAELHWYEAHGVGKKEMKIKRILE